MMTHIQKHPFDLATNLTYNNDLFHGKTSSTYANMVGPFGGITAATMLRAVLMHPAREGEPLSLTINFAVAVKDGNFSIKTTITRTNRRTQHWFVELVQEETVMVTATVVCASRRKTWSAAEAKMPGTPKPEEVKSFQADNMPAWISCYDLKMINGAPLAMTQTENPNSETLQWMQDHPKRPIDFLSLTAMCDAFFPRIYVRQEALVPIATVSMTVYFHAREETLATYGEEPILGHTRALRFYDGFYDQTAELWGHNGDLFATTTQMVYYKK